VEIIIIIIIIIITVQDVCFPHTVCGRQFSGSGPCAVRGFVLAVLNRRAETLLMHTDHHALEQ
jgi:hypothetical protein